MHNLNNFYFHIFQPQYRIVAAFLFAAILNFYAIPVIIRIARAKKLFDHPDDRKHHTSSVPTLGGIGIYAAITAVSLTFINTCGLNGNGISSSLTSLPPIIAGLTIIFFIGIKDDLLNISATKKLAAELIALFILIVVGNVRLSSVQGMFGIGEISYLESVFLSMFAGIVIINAFNLIDGIDGLAASVSMLGTLTFGIFFISAGDWEYAVLAFTILGAVLPFLLYNAFGHVNKIFMGDTGSLILGFTMTVLVFQFNEMNVYPVMRAHFLAGPALSFAIIIIPMFDTLRVFFVRIIRKKSPFKADRRHIHHIMLDLGFTHLQASLILIIINLAFVAFAYFFNFLGNSVLVTYMLIAAVALSGLAIWLRRRRFAMNRNLKSVYTD